MPIVKKLGFIKAIHADTVAPTNTKMLWYDENVAVPAADRLKYFNTDTSTWLPISAAGGGGVPAIPVDQVVVGTGVGIVESDVSINSDNDIFDLRDVILDRYLYVKSSVFPAAHWRAEFKGSPASVVWEIPTSQPADSFLSTGASGSEEVLKWKAPNNWANADLEILADRVHEFSGSRMTYEDAGFELFTLRTGVIGDVRMMADDNGSRIIGMKYNGTGLEVGHFSSPGESRTGAILFNDAYVAPYRKMLHAYNARTEYSYDTGIIGVGLPTITCQGGAPHITASGDQAAIDWSFGIYGHASNAFSTTIIRIDNSGGHTLGFAANRWQMSSGDSAPTLGTGIHWLFVIHDPVSTRMVILQHIEIATDI